MKNRKDDPILLANISEPSEYIYMTCVKSREDYFLSTTLSGTMVVWYLYFTRVFIVLTLSNCTGYWTGYHLLWTFSDHLLCHFINIKGILGSPFGFSFAAMKPWSLLHGIDQWWCTQVFEFGLTGCYIIRRKLTVLFRSKCSDFLPKWPCYMYWYFIFCFLLSFFSFYWFVSYRVYFTTGEIKNN